MKKTLAMVLCILFVMACFASCTTNNNAFEPSEAGIIEGPVIVPPPTIACIYAEVTGEFWGVAANGANAALEELKASGKISGDSYLVAPNTEGDAAQQKDLIDEAIQKRVDGIILSPANADEIGAYISDNMKNLADGGIPIIVIERSLYVPDSFDCVISNARTDEWEMGQACGKLAMEVLEGKGQYLCIVEDPRRCWENRATGTIDYIEKNAPDMKRAPMGDDGIFWISPEDGANLVPSIVQEDILKEMDTAIDLAVITTNEAYAIEACNVLKESNLNRTGKTAVIGFGFSQTMYDLIKNGELYGTVGENPYAMGYESIYIMKEYLMGNTKPEEFVYVPFVVVQQGNLETNEVKTYLETMEIDL